MSAKRLSQKKAMSIINDVMNGILDFNNMSEESMCEIFDKLTTIKRLYIEKSTWIKIETDEDLPELTEHGGKSRDCYVTDGEDVGIGFIDSGKKFMCSSGLDEDIVVDMVVTHYILIELPVE